MSNPRDSATNTENDGSVHATTAPNSSLVLQIDKGIGRQFLLVIWLTSFVSAAAVIAFVFMMRTLDTNTGKLAVLQYDHNVIRAELEARGVLPSKNEAGH